MPFLLDLAWRDLRASGRRLWIFVACWVLGVSLVAAGGGLYQQVANGLSRDARLMFGGDVEIEATAPLPAEALSWAAERSAVSRVVELRTMLRTDAGRSQLIELLSADAAYPLYGSVALQPEGNLADTLAERNGRWGAALDASLAQRLGLALGDRVEIGNLSLTVRAFIDRQPDRSLRADWGAAPVLVAESALKVTNVPPMTRMNSHGPWVEPSVLANPTATRANGKRVSSTPPAAPQAANRGSDRSLKRRRRPAMPSTAEKKTPPKNMSAHSPSLTTVSRNGCTIRSPCGGGVGGFRRRTSTRCVYLTGGAGLRITSGCGSSLIA